MFPCTLSGSEGAKQFVAKRVEEGSDTSIIADIPGSDQETVNTLASEAKRHGNLSIAHAASVGPFNMAQTAEVDFVMHVPLDSILGEEAVALMVAEKRFSIPTLTMMERIVSI